ncbi:MAG: DNA helicase UvrD, partial [Gemmatimonadales bacterium]
MKDVKLINAGAGSGKTFELTSRVAEALESGVEPETLMATTFTIRAASELRERIRLNLLAQGRSEEAQGIYDGFIGTLHSICGRLLTEYALEAGLSPALDVLPEEDAEHLFRRATTDVIEERARDIEPAARRLGYDGGGTGYQKRPDWRKAVQEVVSAARTNLIDRTSLEQSADASLESLFDLLGPEGHRNLTDRFRRAVDRTVADLSQVENPMKATQGAVSTLQELAQGLKRPDRLPWADWVRTSKLSVNKAEEAIVEEVREIAAGVLGHPDLRDDLRVLVHGVFGCAAKALDSYQGFKREQGLMDFVDQERQVLDLARDNPAFRVALGDRLAQMMVDEFQDTSPIQLALFLRLHDLAGSSVWVGDPKQAIYGFRGTDPELMTEITRRIPEPAALPFSWRSRKGLVDFCNAVFAEVFQESDKNPVSLQIPEQRGESAHGGWVEAWNLSARNINDEASALAAGVAKLLARQPGIRPGDVAILCRTHDDRKLLATALEALGIRASASRGSLIDTREGRLALAALQYLHDPEDTVALATIVRISTAGSGGPGWL